MKVTDVACHILQCKVDKPFVSARGWVYGTRSTCLVEISTDEGVTGWGERGRNKLNRCSGATRTPGLRKPSATKGWDSRHGTARRSSISCWSDYKRPL